MIFNPFYNPRVYEFRIHNYLFQTRPELEGKLHYMYSWKKMVTQTFEQDSKRDRVHLLKDQIEDFVNHCTMETYELLIVSTHIFDAFIID